MVHRCGERVLPSSAPLWRRRRAKHRRSHGWRRLELALVVAFVITFVVELEQLGRIVAIVVELESLQWMVVAVFWIDQKLVMVE